MPTKSNNMSPMPMQPKIGEASLKFGPDWLRALSSSENAAPSGGGDAGPSHPSSSRGFGGWGMPGGDGRHKDHHSQPPPPSSVQSPRGDFVSRGGASRFKQSENRYSREEMLALYDKNLEAPPYLVSFGTLFIDKMQPPLAFSQPSEEEIRIWHSPQPESSRQGPNMASGGRGYSVRGRGGGIDRGRGRGRGGSVSFYGSARPHEEEERGSSFSRPRNFERSQSTHERMSWGDRNGATQGTDESPRGLGGSWRNRETFGGRRHEDSVGGADDGWRKPRWRRDDGEQDSDFKPGGRRLNRSWSEEENHDNLPEWARDNPSEESGTFDATGAFHGDDRSSRSRINPKEDGSAKPELSGSHADRAVQKRVQDECSAPVITTPMAKDEPKRERKPGEGPDFVRREPPFQSFPPSSITSNHPEKPEQSQPHTGVSSESSLLQKHLIAAAQQHQAKSSDVKGQAMGAQGLPPSAILQSKSSHFVETQGKPQQNNEDDHYRSMTEEAMNLVSKLIEEDGSGSRRVNSAILASLRNQQHQHHHHPPHAMEGNAATPTGSIAPPVLPSVSPSSMEVWYYRDPQGSVQGPFSTQEMGVWCSQGYFNGSLQLRRECDKIFITLVEMGKLYGRNPFVVSEAPPPPPIQDPSVPSALDYFRGGDSQIQAQLRSLQMVQQQQLMSNLGPMRKEEGQPWPNPSSISQVPPQTRSVPNTSLTAEQIQAQLLMSMAKSQGLDRDPGTMDQIHALFQRQMKTPGSTEALLSQAQSPMKSAFPDILTNSQGATTMEATNKSPSAPVNDPIQSLVQQLTSMATNTQQKLNSSKPEQPHVISPWGQPVPVQPSSHPSQGQWGTAHPSQTPWEYREHLAKLQQEQEERERRRKEEEEAERKRLLEEERERVLEQERKLAEERMEHERERERKRYEEEQKRMEEEKQRKQREEQYLMQKQQQEQLMRQKQREEEERAEIQRQKDLQRQQLEQQRQLRDEQTRLAEEQQRVEKERKDKEQAELKIRQERELKLQQQFSWNQQSQQAPAPSAAPGKSLLEIQQEEAVKQEKEASIKKKQQAEQMRLQQQQQQAQQQKTMNLKWAQGSAPTKTPIKSLTEIQAEEQAKLQKQQEQEREKRAVITQQNQQQAAWSSQLTWANRASVLAASGSSTSKKVNGGAWEREESMATKIKGNSSGTQPIATGSNKMQSLPQAPTRPTSKDGEDNFMKLFSIPPKSQEDGSSPSKGRSKSQGQSQVQGPQDDFTRWCSDRIQSIANGTVDIPTFVAFLKEVESPYEVGDYVRSYLGDGKDAKEFSREFLERRSRWRNSRKDGGTSAEDNLCRPASAVNPNSNEFQEVKGKKTKKGKMQKVDSRILGFSTSAATDRLNRDYGDATE